MSEGGLDRDNEAVLRKLRNMAQQFDGVSLDDLPEPPRLQPDPNQAVGFAQEGASTAPPTLEAQLSDEDRESLASGQRVSLKTQEIKTAKQPDPGAEEGRDPEALMAELLLVTRNIEAILDESSLLNQG